MQRDMNLIKKLLLYIEEYVVSGSDYVYTGDIFDAFPREDYHMDIVRSHLNILDEAGFIMTDHQMEEEEIGLYKPEFLTPDVLKNSIHKKYRTLTWKGYELLDSIRDRTFPPIYFKQPLPTDPKPRRLTAEETIEHFVKMEEQMFGDCDEYQE